jgi:TM2 domain-containing membrane protein YozV
MKTAQVEEPQGGTSPISLRVFVSYDRGNVKSVKTLAEELEALGHHVWFDQDLTGGHRWWDSILAQIRECGLFVFALTAESLESHACKKELDYAKRLNREILPILMSEEVSVSLLPRCLAEIQYVDYRRQDRQTAFALIRAINRLPAPAPLPDPLPEAPAAPGSHLGELKERIDSTGELNIEEQIAIVFKLKEEIRVGRSPDEVRGLLRRLRERDDLRAKVAKEIEAALAGTEDRAATRERAPDRAAPPAQHADTTTRNRADVEVPWTARLPEIGGARNATGKNPTLAAFLSAIVPGLGQFYNGDVKKGWIRLAIAVVGGSATYGLAWFGAAIWSAIDAYQVASGKSSLG